MKTTEKALEDAKKWEFDNFQGKKVHIELADHQYLSNMIWNLMIIHEVPSDSDDLKKIQSEISKRFNGQLLPYRPHIDYKEELKRLYESKLVTIERIGDNMHYTIFYADVEVGEISSHIFIRQSFSKYISS